MQLAKNGMNQSSDQVEYSGFARKSIIINLISCMSFMVKGDKFMVKGLSNVRDARTLR